jgi:CRISPR/Cas system-associated protein Cas10 (large subunit of type III CRISPR-Cas system)
MKYLYGASVQAIQEYIFKTNKLKDIVGASEIVENISQTDFKKEFNLDEEPEIIFQAAGNIRLIFNNRQDLEKVVKSFLKYVVQKAYGITISQAAVEFEELNKDVMNELEKKLKIARNKQIIPLDLHYNFLKLSPTTAKPAVEKINDEYIDKATKQKKDNISKRLVKLLGIEDDIKELELIANRKNKIAVIHSDGNGLGALLQQLGEYLSKDSSKIKKAYKEFSYILDKSTKEAAKKAYEKTKEIYPDMKIRPLILGGDDLSVICDANSALEFTNNYLKEFEKSTRENFKEFVEEFELYMLQDGLTACAGITYANKKFPFHYAISLAEELCQEAKNVSREDSSVLFHNIQSSFYQNFEDLREYELKINDIDLVFGPYFINKAPKLDDFIILEKSLNQKHSPLSRLRNWLKELEKDKLYAQKLLKRIDEMADKKEYKKYILDRNLKKLHPDLSLKNLIVENKTPIYDVIQIASIKD